MTESTPPQSSPTTAMPPNGAPPGSTAAPSNQTPGHPSFRRQRASRACETCHARKVRCDAASLGVPCTNCVAFSIECKIPAPKRKKGHASKVKDSDSDNETLDSPATASTLSYQGAGGPGQGPPNGMPITSLSDDQAAQQATQNGTMSQFMKPKFARAPIKEAGRVAYLGESSNLSLLVHDRHGTTDVVHYPLPDTVKGTRARLTELDNIEIDILHTRGAFLLPPRALCDELVECFFKWVAPVVPVINRSRFMRRYRDNKNPPSLLLLQAILLAGSRVCTNPQLMDASGSTTPAAMTFYKRAKALYDANYEDDRVTIVQALVLMGWYWEGPEDVTKNVFYWSRVATIVAQGSGMHRSVEGSQLSRPDKRLWKRIWWTLFTRDRSVAVALGRPVHINVDDSDVEMITEDDFIEDEVDHAAEYPPNHIHVQFFLHYVKLCEIMGLVLSQQYSVASKAGRQTAINLAHSDMALADWFRNCPKEVLWERNRHHFWSALLHSNYYTTLCLLHRAHMPPASSPGSNDFAETAAYPSRTIAFQAAGMITEIVETLQQHDELKFQPAFIVYSLFSALIMHVYQMRSSVPSIAQASQGRMQICMDALNEVSKVWLVAKMVHTLFLSILGNKKMEERLQKAAGKRHKKLKLDIAGHATVPIDSPPKTEFGDMTLGYPTGPPAPQVSFERSRPQTPAMVSPPNGEQPQGLPGQQSGPGNMNISPNNNNNPAQMRHPDAFLGATHSRSGTRPTTPFNPSYSIPATPPDMYLVTRNSPTISQSLWENFQPDQLFPESTNLHFNTQFGGVENSAHPPNLDPALQMPPMQVTTPQSMAAAAHAAMQSPPGSGVPGMNQMGGPDSSGWSNHLSPEDTWSNSSRSAVPATLNMEDWFQFFGMNQSDLSVLQGEQSSL